MHSRIVLSTCYRHIQIRNRAIGDPLGRGTNIANDTAYSLRWRVFRTASDKSAIDTAVVDNRATVGLPSNHTDSARIGRIAARIAPHFRRFNIQVADYARVFFSCLGGIRPNNPILIFVTVNF